MGAEQPASARTRRAIAAQRPLFDRASDGRRARLVDQVLACFQHSPGLTADEVALMLAKPATSVRPRITELVSAGRLVDTGRRRPGVSTARMAVWKVADGSEARGGNEAPSDQATFLGTAAGLPEAGEQGETERP